MKTHKNISNVTWLHTSWGLFASSVLRTSRFCRVCFKQQMKFWISSFFSANVLTIFWRDSWNTHAWNKTHTQWFGEMWPVWFRKPGESLKPFLQQGSSRACLEPHPEPDFWISTAKEAALGQENWFNSSTNAEPRTAYSGGWGQNNCDQPKNKKQIKKKIKKPEQVERPVWLIQKKRFFTQHCSRLACFRSRHVSSPQTTPTSHGMI